MKKQISSLILGIISTAVLNAQTINPSSVSKAALKLSKQTKMTMNQKITAEGQDMSTRMENASTVTYDISAITAQGGTAEMKFTAMKISSESDAGEMSYDSQNPDEGDSRIGASVKETMNTPIKITLDANGLVTNIKGNEKIAAASNGLPSDFEKGEPLNIFLKLDKSIKPGDVWTSKKDTKDAKITNDYTYKSFENGIATIELIATMKLDQKMEQMGMTMYSKMEGKMVSTMTVDVNSLVIKTKSTTGVLNGTIETQGQSIPMSIFMNSNETIQ